VWYALGGLWLLRGVETARSKKKHVGGGRGLHKPTWGHAFCERKKRTGTKRKAGGLGKGAKKEVHSVKARALPKKTAGGVEKGEVALDEKTERGKGHTAKRVIVTHPGEKKKKPQQQAIKTHFSCTGDTNKRKEGLKKRTSSRKTT